MLWRPEHKKLQRCWGFGKKVLLSTTSSTSWRATGVVAAISLLTLSSTSLAQEKKYTFELPSLPLAKALQAYGRISGRQIIFTEDLVAGHQAAALHGVFTPEDALRELLKGTNLRVERTPSGAAMIRSEETGQSRPNSSTDLSQASGAMSAQAERKALPQSEALPAAKNEVAVIVVTARKREENLQVVPVSVTAIGRETLEDIRFENLKDLNAIAPGVTVRLEAGGVAGLNLTMRGIYGTATFVSESGVAVYTDGIYIPSTRLQMDLADIERLEVLRGPQGTLFGLNALAGAINIITKEPSGELRVRQQLSTGNDSQFRSKTSVDLPKWGLLSTSITFLHDEKAGDVKNLGAGTAWHWDPATNGLFGDRISPSTLGGNNTNAVAAAAKLKTENGIKAVYRFNYSHRTYTPDAEGILSFDAGPAMAYGLPLSSFTQGAYNNQPAALRTPISSRRPDVVNNWFTTYSHEEVDSHTLAVTVPIAEGISIGDLWGYRYDHVDATNDLSGAGGLLTSYLARYTGALGALQAANAGPPGTPYIPLVNATDSAAKTFQNELQFTADTRWVHATAGYLYYHNKADEGGFPGSFNVAILSGLTGPPMIDFTPYPYGAQHSLITSISNAVYTQDEVHVLNKLDVVAGVRYTRDQRSGVDGSPEPAGPSTSVDYSKGVWTYLGGLNYKVTDDIFTYAHYSTGYLAGGQLANVRFNPSYAKSWEVGVKSDFFDETLRVNTDVFTVKYLGVQVLTNAMIGCANVPGVASTAPQCIVNGGDGRANGFDLEATYVTPLQGLTADGSLAYTDFNYTQINKALRAPDGTFVPNYAPKWTSRLAINYTGPELDSVGGSHVVGSFNGAFSSKQDIDTNQTLAVLQANEVPTTWIFNARLGLGGFNVRGADVEIVAYAKNLFNNRNLQYGTPLNLIVSGNYQPARLFGAELTIEFYQ
jgi:iron complex outermembrane receptor protein